MTCWRRLRDWQRAGVWHLIHFALLNWLARCDQIDWSRVIVDSCSIRAVHGGDQTAPNPTDRAKRGSKRHLICGGRGVPLAVRLTGANRNDSQEALALVDAIPPLCGARGRPRHVTNIVIDHRTAVLLALEHLMKLGRRDVAFMKGPVIRSDTEDRWKSIHDVAVELGIRIQPELTVRLDDPEACAASAPEYGYPFAKELLSRKRPFTALFA
jgi:transposase